MTVSDLLCDITQCKTLQFYTPLLIFQKRKCKLLCVYLILVTFVGNDMCLIAMASATINYFMYSTIALLSF